MTLTSRRILMVSWKDVRHPRHGGAEVYTRIVLEGLVGLGASVTWLAPRVRGQPDEEVTPGGVRLLRRGTAATQPLAVWRHLRARRGEYDLVIDQINTWPMLTRFMVPRRQGLVLMHQLAADVWPYEVPRPLALLGAAAEPRLLRLYRDWPAVTVSGSTAGDLRRLGFRDVSVVENALTFPLPPRPSRERPEEPHLVGLGRLVRMKRFEHLLEAFALVRLHHPAARLTVIGRGATPYARELARRIAATPGAELLENAREATKREVLSRATAVVATSVREGWGLMVTEGHAYGTPSVAYRVPGLADSTRHGVTGLLCEPAPHDLARALLDLHRDPARWAAMSRAAHEAAARMTPRRTAEAFADVVSALIGRRS